MTPRGSGSGASAGSRNLARGARTAPQWRTPVAGRAPRLGPREYIGTGAARGGRFAKVDPLVTRPLWPWRRWLGLAFWAVLTGEAGRRAWRRHGGPTADQDEG